MYRKCVLRVGLMHFSILFDWRSAGSIHYRNWCQSPQPKPWNRNSAVPRRRRRLNEEITIFESKQILRVEFSSIFRRCEPIQFLDQKQQICHIPFAIDVGKTTWPMPCKRLFCSFINVIFYVVSMYWAGQKPTKFIHQRWISVMDYLCLSWQASALKTNDCPNYVKMNGGFAVCSSVTRSIHTFSMVDCALPAKIKTSNHSKVESLSSLCIGISVV